MTLEEISFDNDDKNLFLVDDLQLKAEAIRHSILPKLEIITNNTISRIDKIYVTNVLCLSTVVKYPHFRKSRTTEVKIDYTSSEAGFGAKRDKDLWQAVLNQHDKQPMILPFSLSYRLDEDGLWFYFRTNRFNLKLNSYEKFLNFHNKYANEINSLSNEAKMFLDKYDYDEYKISSLSPIKTYLKWQIENGFWDVLYFSRVIKYPISSYEIDQLVNDFCAFYPIYESYLKLACGEKVSIKEDMQFLVDWKRFGDPSDENLSDGNYEKEAEKIPENSAPKNMDLIKLAETKIRVMPALRWQVFARDNWNCVSCGKTSGDGRLLHVDHIIPRSKGGLNHLDNYQTLCSECNIGKSNRDQTNLRNRNIE